MAQRLNIDESQPDYRRVRGATALHQSANDVEQLRINDLQINDNDQDTPISRNQLYLQSIYDNEIKNLCPSPTYYVQPNADKPNIHSSNITRDNLSPDQAQRHNCNTIQPSPTQQLRLGLNLDLPPTSIFDDSQFYQTAPKSPTIPQPTLYKAKTPAPLLKRSQPTHPTPPQLQPLQQKVPARPAENTHLTIPDLHPEPTPTKPNTDTTNDISPVNQTTTPPPTLTKRPNQEPSPQPPPAKHSHQHEGYSLSALMIRDNTYIILINIQTQKTHITQIGTESNQTYNQTQEKIKTWLHENTPHQTNTRHITCTDNPSDKNNIMATKFQTLILETTTAPTQTKISHKHSQTLIHSGHLQNQTLDTEQHTITTKILQHLIGRHGYSTAPFNTHLHKLNTKMTNTTSQNTHYRYKRYTDIRQTFAQRLQQPAVTTHRILYRPRRTSNSPVRIARYDPNRLIPSSSVEPNTYAFERHDAPSQGYHIHRTKLQKTTAPQPVLAEQYLNAQITSRKDTYHLGNSFSTLSFTKS